MVFLTLEKITTLLLATLLLSPCPLCIFTGVKRGAAISSCILELCFLGQENSAKRFCRAKRTVAGSGGGVSFFFISKSQELC